MQLAFRTRLMLGTTAMVVLFVGACAVAFAHVVDGYFEQQLAREYDEARSSLDAQRRLLLETLDRQVRELSRSPRLLAMMDIEGVDEVTLLDVLGEVESQLLAVLRPDGRVLASRAAWPATTNLSRMPGFERHHELGSATHVWPHPDGLAIVGIAPLVQGDVLLGSLVYGRLVDQDFAEHLGALSGRDVALVHDGRLLGTRWPSGTPSPSELGDLLAARPADLPPEGRPMSVDVSGSTAFGIVAPLRGDCGIVFLGQELGGLFALRDRMRALLLLIGGATIAFGLLFATRTALRMSKPLRRLTTAAERLREGDLGARVGELDSDRELSRLGRSFDSMAAAMQELIADGQEKAARAEAANRAKDGFLTSMSHELRTPLTGIQSTAELLQQFGEEASAEERHEFLDTILRESTRLAERITDTLEYAALAGDQAGWTLGPVDLQQAAEEACRRTAVLQQLKNVEVSIFCERTCRLQGDRERIVQAIEHLLRNAWQWSPDGGQVELTVRVGESSYSIEVADRGPGLRADERQRVFERFAQGGDVLVDKPDGLGIGLKITAEVARMHGGGVEYRDRDGGGAAFFLLLRTTGRPIDERAASRPTHAAATD